MEDNPILEEPDIPVLPVLALFSAAVSISPSPAASPAADGL